MKIFRSAPLALIGVMLLATACARDDAATEDTMPMAAADFPAVAIPGTMAGMSRPVAKDADHEFLRAMSDHHEGLIQMATAAMTKASQTATQGDAHQMHTKQAAELKRMVDMVQSMYGETLMPMTMAEHKMMTDELQSKTGADYDRTFYQNVIAHHREAIKMVDDMMPRLIKADIKAMATKMKADQQKEITAFEKKVK